MKLTQNFTLDELLASQTATRYGIKEQFEPPQSIIENLTLLCTYILQPLRDELGPLKLSSGYRSPKVNERVGAKSTSQHCKGQAADCNFVVNGVEDNMQIVKKVLELNLPFDQMILEFGTDDKPAWIHLSYDRLRQRGNILRAKLYQGKTHYTTLFKEDLK